MTSRPYLPKEYRLSDLHDELDVPSVPDDKRSMHTLFAILFNDIDRRADIHQSIKPEILEGLAQAWLYFAENHDGVDVIVEQHRHGVNTEIDDPSTDQRASMMGRQGSTPSVFDERIREQADGDIGLATFERDMRRLDDLRRKYASPGLNTIEGNEKRELIDKYNLEHHEWWQRNYLADETKDEKTSDCKGAV